MKDCSIQLVHLDQDIKRLLFANPSLGIGVCSKILKALQCNTVDEKQKIRSWLERDMAIYKSKARDLDSTALYEDLCHKTMEHITAWEETFGVVTLSDIQFLIDSTDIKLVDVGWDHISPASIAAMLDEHIIGQKEYNRELGLCVYLHMLREHNPEMNLMKYNLLVYGPSGVGKTSGVKFLADKMNIRIAIVNCNTLVQDGIQGSTISDAFTRALKNKYEYLIIIFDEFDKLFTGNGVYNDRILQEFLNVLDFNNTISFPTSFDSNKTYKQIPSKNVTCIMCGKFDALRQMARERMFPHTVGFETGMGTLNKADDFYRYVTLDDLKKVLGSDELCGRIGQFVRVNRLTSDDLMSILMDARDSIFTRYESFFSAHKATLVLTEGGAKEIAEYTLSNHADLGARGLESVLQHLLKEKMMQIDQFKDQVIKIDEDYVKNYINF